MNLLSSFASWFEGNSASVAFALLGGFIVACGLGLEKIAEILDGRFLGGYKAHKTMEWFGWSVLILGIWIEIADAGWTAHEIKKAERIAIENNPLNRPISDVSAVVTFDLEGTNFVESPIGVEAAFLEFDENDIHIIASGMNEFGALIAEKGDVGRRDYSTVLPRPNAHGYNLRFIHPAGEYVPVTTGSRYTPYKAKWITDNVKVLMVNAYFIPHDAELLGGNAEILVNGGNIRLDFDILPQKSLSGPLGRFPGFTLIATNATLRTLPSWMK